eukprot:CAMPEP_0181490948 /NCGR_PEP_ID=MMETSP1110-20121109/49844_1 /TAXON_ID=174948 /ORGANISM="Symbiodinium sp., Strain CCMP421" /LENGTH=32 /DNA_ID= /DNA_START= /DNA_END= /DNA_ORIENTATION=
MKKNSPVDAARESVVPGGSSKRSKKRRPSASA